jgi:hypothetical protein
LGEERGGGCATGVAGSSVGHGGGGSIGVGPLICTGGGSVGPSNFLSPGAIQSDPDLSTDFYKEYLKLLKSIQPSNQPSGANIY